MVNAIITGTGASLPSKVLTNADLEKMVDTNDEWIRTRSGISERRILAKGELISDFCTAAANQALKKASLSIDDIDLIINATFTSDSLLPSGACVIQDKLGATKPIPAFDLAAACSGFVYGLEVARNFIKSETYKNILVMGSDALSPYTNWEDRGTCVIFGDGAGAAVVSATDDSTKGIMCGDLGAVGKHAKILDVPGGGSALPPHLLASDPSLKDEYFIHMAGNELFKIVTRLVIDSVKRLIEKSDISLEDIDYVVPHQANIRIIQYVAKKLGLPMEKMGITLDKYGNSSAGTVPITLHECIEEGKIKKGDNVVLTAFGGGLTYASILIKM